MKKAVLVLVVLLVALMLTGCQVLHLSLWGEKCKVPWGEEPVTGVELGPLFAEASDITGVQVGGGVAFGDSDIRGVQVGGMRAYGTDDVTGIQIGGLRADGAGNVSGLQIAGGLNRAKRVRGVQLGLVNWCDDLSGTQIGLINISKNHKFPFIPFINIRSGKKDEPAVPNQATKTPSHQERKNESTK